MNEIREEIERKVVQETEYRIVLSYADRLLRLEFLRNLAICRSFSCRWSGTLVYSFTEDRTIRLEGS